MACTVIALVLIALVLFMAVSGLEGELHALQEVPLVELVLDVMELKLPRLLGRPVISLIIVIVFMILCFRLTEIQIRNWRNLSKSIIHRGHIEADTFMTYLELAYDKQASSIICNNA